MGWAVPVPDLRKFVSRGVLTSDQVVVSRLVNRSSVSDRYRQALAEVRARVTACAFDDFSSIS